MHAWEHLQVPVPEWAAGAKALLALFPGVPIFFVISGFLISRSWERSREISSYGRNRFFRIYPALWAAFVPTLGLAIATGFVGWPQITSGDFWIWIAAQVSIVQFYNPDFLRGLGVGVINGSLWTIPVELAFYVFLPFLYRLGIDRLSSRSGDLLIGTLAAASFAAFVWSIELERGDARPLAKLLQVTLVPHLFMFLFGILLQRRLEILRSLLEGRGLHWIVAFVLVVAPLSALREASGVALGAYLLLHRCLLAFLTISFAFTVRTISDRLLHGNDISYGVYLYHMLVVNFFVHVGFVGDITSLITAICATIVLGIASWRLVEAPALRHKKHALHPVA